jgi:peptidoglycan/xylan/chitin deacetylase (PgdA/CDA1 family)
MNLLKLITTHWRAARLRRNHRGFLIVLNWHQVTPEFSPSIQHKYTWTQLDVFKAAVRYLEEEFRILPLYDALGSINRGTLRGPCAALTFDDGDISIANYVAPFLRQRNLPATFFINSAYLDGHSSYWFPVSSFLMANDIARSRADFSDELRAQALQLRQTDDPAFYNRVRERVERLAFLVPDLGSRLVSEAWISNLDGDQFAIGAHGHEHQRLSMMAAEWQRNDLCENVKCLSQFRAYRPIFAVPFGRAWDWTQETIGIARAQGLYAMLAGGGINLSAAEVYRRIPSDGRAVRRLVAEAMAQY